MVTDAALKPPGACSADMATANEIASTFASVHLMHARPNDAGRKEQNRKAMKQLIVQSTKDKSGYDQHFTTLYA